MGFALTNPLKVNNQWFVHDVLTALVHFGPSRAAVRSWEQLLEVRSLAHLLMAVAVHLPVAVEKSYFDRWEVASRFEREVLDFRFARRSSAKHRLNQFPYQVVFLLNQLGNLLNHLVSHLRCQVRRFEMHPLVALREAWAPLVAARKVPEEPAAVVGMPAVAGP